MFGRWPDWLLVLLGLLVLYLCSDDSRADSIPRAAVHYRLDLVRNARETWGITAPVSTFAGQIHQESRWRWDAKSHYAAGLAQFTPQTATWIEGVFPELHGAAPMNPVWAIRALTRYDHWLWDRIRRHDSDCDRIAFALQAYNGGLGFVYRRQRRVADAGKCFDAACDINPGITPANQQQAADYPRLILKRWEPLYIRAGWGPGSCDGGRS